MTRVFLIGYMGTGKTTLGKAFSRSLNIPFIDLDWYIENRYHKTVGQIFSEHGEAYFRELERTILHEVGEFEDVVISTGGGTPCFFDNMDYMKAQGQTVFLDAAPEVLLRRLKAGKHKRPKLKDKTDEELAAFIAEAMEERLPFYRQAHYNFDSSRLESKTQLEESVNGLRKLLSL